MLLKLYNKPTIQTLAALSYYKFSNLNFDSSKDYYKILKVSEKANQSQIKTQFYKLAKIYHPDTNSKVGAEDQFKLINQAYTVLSDEKSKLQYDNSRFKHPNRNSSSPNNYNKPEQPKDNFHSQDWAMYRRGGFSSNSRNFRKGPVSNQEIYRMFRQRNQYYKQYQQQHRRQFDEISQMIKRSQYQWIRQQKQRAQRDEKIRKMQQQYENNNSLIGFIWKWSLYLLKYIWNWVTKRK